jgi:hypothetical protein
MGTRQKLLASAARCTAVPANPPQQRDADRHLNQEQLARRWQVSPRTLERHRWLGVGVPYLKLGGRVVYRLEDILAYEADSLRGGR